MRKRTRIAVVSAALLLAVVAPTVTGAIGNDQATHAGVLNGGITVGQRAGGSIRYLISGRPPVDLRAGANVARRLRDMIPPSKERWELIEVACKVKDLTVPEKPMPDMTQIPTDRFGSPVHPFEAWRQQEIKARLERLRGWQGGAGGSHASVKSLLKGIDEAEDRGDAAMVGADILCLSVDVVLDGHPD